MSKIKQSMVDYAIENIKLVYEKYGHEEARLVAETWQRNIQIDAKKILNKLKNKKEGTPIGGSPASL